MKLRLQKSKDSNDFFTFLVLLPTCWTPLLFVTFSSILGKNELSIRHEAFCRLWLARDARPDRLAYRTKDFAVGKGQNTSLKWSWDLTQGPFKGSLTTQECLITLGFHTSDLEKYAEISEKQKFCCVSRLLWRNEAQHWVFRHCMVKQPKDYQNRHLFRFSVKFT